MKKLFLLLMTVCVFACGNSKEENEENAKAAQKNIKPSVNNMTANKPTSNKKPQTSTKKVDIAKSSDFNQDGVIDGSDWKKLSNQEKINLVNYYNELTYQSLGLVPSKEVKIKEGKQMLAKLNSFYTKSDNYERDVYSIMVSGK